MSAPAPVVVDDDALYPRDAQHRYRLYALEPDGRHTVRACAPDSGGIGAAIFQLAEDRRAAGLGPEVVGVLDAIEHTWITTPWAGRS